MNKQFWLDLAEILDAWRVIPRLLVGVFTGSYLWYAVDSVFWVKAIYNECGTVPGEILAFTGSTLSALGLVLTLVINKYFTGGRAWLSKEKEEFK